MEEREREYMGEAGTEGKQDCKVTVLLKDSGGIDITLHSKMKSLFGKAIHKCVLEQLAQMKIENASVVIYDNGCLDFGIRAHLETAVHRAQEKRVGKAEKVSVNFDGADSFMIQGRPMRSMLFCPANQPKHYISAPVFGADCMIFDLEDAVAFDQKDAARDLLCQAVRTLNLDQERLYARINSLHTPYGEKDVRAIVPAGVRNLRLAMCQSKEDVMELDQLLSEVERLHGIIPGSVKIQCSIETPKGVLHAEEAVAASERVTSLSFGAEDYTRSLGVSRSKGAQELEYARRYLPVVAAQAGIFSIDTAWSWIDDMEGFIEEAKTAKAYGFSGKSCVHPRQIREVHNVFRPSEGEVQEAMEIVKAMEEARERGIGVIAVNGKMVDDPVLVKAQKILSRAEGRR